MKKKILRWTGYAILAFVLSVMVVFFIAYLKREEIKQNVVLRLNERVNGTFTVDKINFTIFHHFPDFSITLQQVVLRDSTDHQAVLTAEKIFLDIGLYALFRKEIKLTALAVNNGSVFLYRGKQGYSNTAVFKPKRDTVAVETTEGGGYTLNLDAIAFKQVSFTYVDSLKEKRIIFQLKNTYHELKRDQGIAEMLMTGDIHCRELTFNSKAGGFLVDTDFHIDLTLHYHDSAYKLIILPSQLEIGNNKIDLKGEFLLNDSADYSLQIVAKNILFADGLSYVTKRIQTTLQKFQLDKPIDLDVTLKGKHNNGEDPEADVLFSGTAINFAFDILKVKEVTCVGNYLHRPDPENAKADNSSITIESFHGKIEGVGFHGKVTFTKLYDPMMDLSMQSVMNHTNFNNLVDTTEWVSRSGTFTSSVKYKGQLEEYLDATRSKYYGKLAGNFSSHNGMFIYKPKNIILKNVNAGFHFTEKLFTIDSLSLLLNNNAIHITGSMTNYIPFFIQPANKGFVKLNLVSPKLDLTFIASTKVKEQKSDEQQMIERKQIASVFNTLQRKLQFDIAVNAGNFTYKKFKAQNIKGKVTLDGDILETSNVAMNVAKGDMLAKISFRHNDAARRELAVNTQLKGADIREFFTLFDNFGQNTIHAENLAGDISATANFSATVNKDFTLDPASMKGKVSCKIFNGQLIDFEPMENLSNFLFRKRDFSDVQFATLESNFQINGTDMDIDRMEVQSTVLSFFLQGRYSFTDSTSLSLQLPLNNLKKRDKNYKPENIGTKAKSGMSVYLHIYRDKDINSKINIAYDPFKKWVPKQ